MNPPTAELLLITLASDLSASSDLPRAAHAALCAINMLLVLDRDILERKLPCQFTDFTVAPLDDKSGARVAFVDSATSKDLIVDQAALRHLKSVGNFRDLRVGKPRAKL